MLLHLSIVRRNKGSLLTIDLILAGPQISLLGLNTLALGDELVSEDQNQIQGNTQVSGDEVLVVEVAPFLVVREDVVVLGENDQNAETQGDVGADDAEGGDVGQVGVGDVLGATGAHEVDVGDQDRDPGQETEDSDQVDEVLEDGLRVVGNVHVGDQSDGRTNGQSIDWDTATVGTGEDLGGLALASETVDSTGGDVQIRVGGREDEQQNASIQDVRQIGDSRVLNGNDKRRGSSGAAGLGELGVVVGQLRVIEWHQGTNQKDREHVEDQDTPESQLDRTGDGATRVLRLTDCDTDQFGTQVGEGGGDHSRPERQEAASIALQDIMVEGTGALPVAETLAIVVGTTTQHEDEGEQDNSKNDDDLERGQPELEFTEEAHAKVVDAYNCNQQDGDPDSSIHFILWQPV